MGRYPFPSIPEERVRVKMGIMGGILTTEVWKNKGSTGKRTLGGKPKRVEGPT